ncbi:hypothetical protein [Streptomyces sp. Tu 3180]|uniref:hypothetical protein n=1 Tax=Streptomyces sp. Tu 3180 TaxID=2682611 RepID=UPI00135B44E0|nr:hypothetical protein [Streptomyces sp. Tu 3180]KAF3468853.1 hypothetical protein GL259_34300 [Streptomyces sp. Tu 3180]
MTHRTLMTAVLGAAAVAVVALPAVATASPHDSGTPVTVTREKGHVLACTGTASGVEVTADLYDNDVFGTHAAVSVRTPDDEYVRGGETEAGLFRKGRVEREFVVGSETSGTARTVVISGAYVRSGLPKRVHEVYDEPYGQVVTKGWNYPLKADVTARTMGQQVKLTCGDAFAYKLTTWRPDSTAE